MFLLVPCVFGASKTVSVVMGKCNVEFQQLEFQQLEKSELKMFKSVVGFSGLSSLDTKQLILGMPLGIGRKVGDRSPSINNHKHSCGNSSPFCMCLIFYSFLNTLCFIDFLL